MREPPLYTDYHPRWLRRRVSTWWWLQQRDYMAFIAREVSSVFIAWTVVFLLLLVRAVGQGEGAYLEFIGWAAATPIVLLNGVSLLFILFHAVTWFNLAPAALVVHVRGRKLPGGVIAASNYAAFAAASALIAWLLLR